MLLFVSISLIPIWTVHTPPLVDYPNHMARMHILVHARESPVLQQYYEVRWAVLPNLAMDVVIPSLTKVVPLEVAGKLFLSLIFVLLSVGVLALHRALHGEYSAWPILCVFFLYNNVFRLGFLNYLFGVGLALLVLAAWVVCRHRSWKVAIPVFSFLSGLIFFSHLFALGFYALSMLAYEFGQYRVQRQQRWPLSQMTWPKAVAHLVLPLMLFALSPTFYAKPDERPPATPAAQSTWQYRSTHGLRWSSNLLAYGDFSRRVDAFKGTLRTFHPPLDRITLVALAAIIIMGVVTKRFTLKSSMYWPLVCVAAAALAMPAEMATANFVDIRLPTALILLAIASSNLASRGKAWTILVAGTLSILFLIRIGYITQQWQLADRTYGEYLAALDRLPEGATLFPAVVYPSPGHFPGAIPDFHVASWAVLKKSAFVSSVFAFPTQQPLALRQPYRNFILDGFFLPRSEIPW
ncbi:MAG TPA: hypothetical protein VJV04_02310, partial [Nitrospiraceae bacterium]|nr:hypothetical protein [Nitrospiraceae bacterium]